MGLHGTDVHAAVAYVGFVGDPDLWITYGSDLWMQSLVDCWQGLRFIYFIFILTLRQSFVPGGFLPLCGFPPYLHLLST